MTLSLAVLGYVALTAVAVLFAWRAVRRARTPQGSVGWVVFLLALPVAAVPAYMVFGHHRLTGPILARRDSARTINALRDYARGSPPAHPPRVDPAPFEAAAQMPVFSGNALDLLIDGPAAFGAMFAAIDRARTYVLVQFYIIRDDDLGDELADRLLAARARGVEVYLAYDRIGSWGLDGAYVRRLAAAGVRVARPRRRRGTGTRLRVNFRNHRKTVIVDGVTGFTGGLNVGDEYMGRDPSFGAWRDTHVALRGPVVAQLQVIFCEDWHYATGDDVSGQLLWQPERQPQDMTALIAATGPADRFDSGALLFFSAITAARRRVWIASPYFVPDIDTLAALKHAALRGVEVRLLLPDSVDHRLVWLAAFAFFDEIADLGVEVWRYTDGFMHQKVVLVDDTLAGVGTTNLDNRSFRLNFEAMALAFDGAFAREVEAMLAADFARAYRMTRRLSQQPLAVRLGAPVARLFAPIL